MGDRLSTSGSQSFPSMICSASPSTNSKTLEWILFTACVQHITTTAITLLFIAIVLGFAIHRALFKSRSNDIKPDHGKSVGRLFTATLLLTVLAAVIWTGFEAWSILSSSHTGAFPVKISFITSQALKWLVYAASIRQEKKVGAAIHSKPIRIWWMADFVLTTLLLAIGITRNFLESELLPSDFAILVTTYPVNLFLLAVALRGDTGITAVETSSLRQPLLTDGEFNVKSTTPYASAGLISRSMWKWLTPLLDKGYQSQLQLRDIPQLAVEDRVESTHSRFRKEWPETPGAYPVRTTLLACFGRQLLLNGLLAIVRLSVMYAGPVLIQRFVDFTAGNRSGSPYEGYYLVIVLLAAKCVEVLTSHQYNFQSQKLGMSVRATVIAAVYQKGLRLSTSSKQSHGVGHIVNYMVVDAQQLSDLVFQLHNLWVLPAQVCIALAILYQTLGLPMLTGFGVMVIVIACNVYWTEKQKQYQKRLMEMRDERMKATGEVLNFMKIIKFQAWEDYFLGRVEGYRNRECEELKNFLYVLAENIIALWICGSLVAATTFSACVLFGFKLTPGKVFTANATFRILQEPVRNFPNALISLAQSLVSLDRLDKYMLSEELDQGAVERLHRESELAVEVVNGCFAWEGDETPTLKDINLEVRKGHLVTIVGTVGSGKSSILTALLGEMRKLSGTVKLFGSTAYVPQTAWIQNGTIKDNILFGSPMDRTRYVNVLRSCALVDDLKLMEFGDQTEIGERGINMSGGQKQRIQLARAVYQDTDIYLLDDVFSAVDAHTGTHLFQECVRGCLRGKTVILVTHQVEFLHGADMILVMRDGVIVQSGKYTELVREGTDLEALVAAHQSAMESISPEKTEEEIVIEHPVHVDETKELRSLSIQKTPSNGNRENKGTSKLIDEEQRQLGRVGWRVYWLYFCKGFGWPTLPVVVFIQLLWTILFVVNDYFLASETSRPDFSSRRFLIVYLSLSVITWILVAVRVIVQTASGFKSAQSMYFEMLRNIFRSPMSFFDTTPSGRILSRSSTDQATLDVLLPFFSAGAVAVLLSSTAVLVVACQVTWPLIFLLVPLIWTFVSYQNYFLTSSRELTRLDSITKAPVIFHFSETLAGLVTIRAFRKEGRFIQLNLDRVNNNICMDFHNNSANEWLGFRLEMIGTVVLCVSALLLVTLPANMVQPEKAGLSLSYGLSLNAVLFWSVWLLCMLENKMVAVERIRQYTTIESEAPRIIDSYRPPLVWPSKGDISVDNLQLRYRPNTPLVLKGVSLRIQGGSKVGVVGRTGSGKSTLIQAFFRLVEPCGGRIMIDDIDITKLGLADLRSSFGIIPQEPILFEGSVRSNVDPLGQYSDERIWEVLRKCQLAETVEQKAARLDSVVTDNGENWSVGQKQLFCLGRALLRQSKVLFLDEATASVDAQTDAIIQRTIREQFATSTVVSVAHRIPSVMDSDKVLVMGEGEVREYDSPSALLDKPNSLFGALVREYATRSG